MAIRSSHKQYSQQQLTKILFSVADSTDITIRELHLLAWKNPTNPNSLHLSTAGWALVAKLKMQVYKYEFSKPLNGKTLLQLERYLNGPYYVYKQSHRLAILDEQDHLMLELHAGNIAEYLDNLEKYS